MSDELVENEDVASKRSRSLSDLVASDSLQSVGLMAFLAVLIVFFSFTSPYFFSTQNLVNILLSVSVIGTMAAVMTLMLVSGSLDMSIGSVVGLVGVVVATCVSSDWPWWVAILIGILVGVACGAVNGFIVVKLRINSIITTIATLSLFRGLAYIYTEGQTVYLDSAPIVALGSGRLFGIPYSVGMMLAIFAVCGFVASSTVAGRTLYAIGANARASLLSGINLGIFRFWTFIAVGATAALAGVLLLGQTGTAVPAGGSGYELMVVTAVLLGGASLYGGEGRVLGTLLGVLIIGVLANGMTLIGIGSYYQTAANGILLLLAVGMDQLRRGSPTD